MEVNSNSVEFVNTGLSKLVQRKSETPSGVSRKQVLCEFCNKKFATARGKHIHENRIHPIEYHKARAGLPYSKARWTEEEYCMLAVMEAEMIRNGVHNVNKELHKRFKHRTLNAIKSQRLADTYKAILERYLTRSATTTLTETSIPTVIMSRFKSCRGKNSSPSCSKPSRHRVMESIGYGKIEPWWIAKK